MRANEDSGRSPIPSWRDDSEVHYVRWMGERGSPSGLSDLEIEVAKAIAAEWDAVAQKHPFSPEIYFYSMGNWLSPSRDYQLLKLLHVCSVLKLQGYGEMRGHVLRCISESISDERLSTMIHQPWLLQALILHGSADGVASLEQLLISMTQKVVDKEQAHLVWLKANVFRKLYHLAFAKADFTCCLRVARDGHRLVADVSGAAPSEVGLGEMQSNLLTCKHWKYLELRAAIEIASESDSARQSLLSVKAPATYFSDENDYCIREVIDFDFGVECYLTPYGHSIIKGGDWMKTLSAILEAEGGFSSQQEIEVAQRIIAELGPLMEDLSDQENAFAAWSFSDFE